MSRHNQAKVWGSIALAVVVCLAALCLPATRPLAAQGGSIVLDGVGTDWDTGWQMASDGLDVFITDSQLHPHQSPTYARSGYDAIALWAHYQSSDDHWYFRIDVDGRAGDSDSQTGTEGNLGVGTHGPDGGPLNDPDFPDGVGLGNSEAYKLAFRCAPNVTSQTAEISNRYDIVPGVVASTTMGLDGLGVYSDTVPGVVEFAFNRATLFPADVACPQLWLSAQVGDNNDRVSDDQVTATLVIALDLAVFCPAAPAVAGDEATFTLDFAIPAEAGAEVTDVVLVTSVPAGTQFVSASDGGTEAGGSITWQLGSLAPGTVGQVTFTALVGAAVTSVTLDSEMTSAEGLRFVSSDVCPVQQPSPTPTNTPTPTSTSTSTPTSTTTPRPPVTPTPTAVPPDTPVVPEPASVVLMLAGLGTLAGYAGLQWRARHRP
ncbi:MAG: DUF11 domain-containing protein [Anaerolineae bacterium]|nr:DUF11 domain-containing protein [Anaerolineae bacterium]